VKGIVAGKSLNVLFITADQWRGDCLGALAHPCLKTPNLDRLTADGVLFSQHFCQASPCGPARASLYTGLYMHHHRAVDNGTPLDARFTNIALEARKVGHDPALFGYTDISADPRALEPGDPRLHEPSGVLPGMVPVVLTGGGASPWLDHLKARGYNFDTENFFSAMAPDPDFPDREDRGLTYAPARFAAEDSHPAFLTDALLHHIGERSGGTWFAHLSYLAPHPPFIVPQPYHDMYSPAAVPAPLRAATLDEEAAQHPYLKHHLYHQHGWGIRSGFDSRNNIHLSEQDIAQARATYYAMMSEVDAQLGRLIGFLKEQRLYDRTLIVFTSDHGEQLGDHWQFAKYGYFDQSFHIPLIVRDPRVHADPGRGRQVRAFTESVDVMPSILDCLGADIPAQCDGESLAPFLFGETPEHWREDAHWELDFRTFASFGTPVLGLKPDQCAFSVIRGERYKYVHFTALPALLFDLERDPGEFINRAADPAYHEVALECAQRLISWRMNHDERVLSNTLLTPQGMQSYRGPRR